MQIEINLLEIASEMAHRELLLQTCIEYGIPEGEAEGKITYLTHDVVQYREEYQDKFNRLYDEYYDSVLALGKPMDDNLFVWSKDDVQRHFDCTEGEAFEVIEKLNDNDYANETINEMIVLIGDELELKSTIKEDE